MFLLGKFSQFVAFVIEILLKFEFFWDLGNVSCLAIKTNNPPSLLIKTNGALEIAHNNKAQLKFFFCWSSLQCFTLFHEVCPGTNNNFKFRKAFSLPLVVKLVYECKQKHIIVFAESLENYENCVCLCFCLLFVFVSLPSAPRNSSI